MRNIVFILVTFLIGIGCNTHLVVPDEIEITSPDMVELGLLLENTSLRFEDACNSITHTCDCNYRLDDTYKLSFDVLNESLDFMLDLNVDKTIGDLTYELLSMDYENQTALLNIQGQNLWIKEGDILTNGLIYLKVDTLFLTEIPIYGVTGRFISYTRED
jgi:hypothetical protein